MVLTMAAVATVSGQRVSSSTSAVGIVQIVRLPSTISSPAAAVRMAWYDLVLARR